MFEKVQTQLKMGSNITPIFFLYNDEVDIFYNKFQKELDVMCSKFWVDMYDVHILSRNDIYSHKIDSVKSFILKSSESPRNKFQVFVFEDFWRLTIQSQNACLKFLEEPWKTNIIFITGSSLSHILETILSRVHIQIVGTYTPYVENIFFSDLIHQAISGNKEQLIRHFFSQKIEKDEFLDFLKTLLYVIVNTRTYIHIYQDLYDDIQGIEKNNFIARNIADKYICIL